MLKLDQRQRTRINQNLNIKLLLNFFMIVTKIRKALKTFHRDSSMTFIYFLKSQKYIFLETRRRFQLNLQILLVGDLKKMLDFISLITCYHCPLNSTHRTVKCSQTFLNYYIFCDLIAQIQYLVNFFIKCTVKIVDDLGIEFYNLSTAEVSQNTELNMIA